MNLKNLVAIQGLVILLPLMIAGLWQHRHEQSIRFAGLMGLGTLALMTLVFPFAGARGGYLHSASAFQTLLWAAVPAGLETFVTWGQGKRNWKPERATPVFGVLVLLVCLFITGWFYIQKVTGLTDTTSKWGYSDQVYRELGNKLAEFSVGPQDLVMVNNPPGFYLATGRSSIVIPGGDVKQALAAAQKYSAKWLILGPEQGNLAELYADPQSTSSLDFRSNVGDLRLFCIECK